MSTVNRGGLPERAAAPPRRWRGFRLSIGVSVGVVAALAAGYVQPAYADGTQVVFNDGQVADVLFGAAVRLSDPGVDYYRSVVTTAELLDWRAGHPAAPEADVEAHAAAVRQQMDAQLTDADKLLMPTELLGRQLQIVQATAGAAVGGPETGRLLAVVTARDEAPGVLHVEQRLSGAQQRYAIDVPYADAQHMLWLDLRKATGSDNDLSGAWKNQMGQPTPQQPAGLDPKWNLSDLKNDVTQLKNLVDVDKLIAAGRQGASQFFDELKKQFEALRDKLNGQQSQLSSAIEDLLTKAGVPGKPGERGPTADQLKQAAKDQKDRQDVIDGIKSGLDVLVWLTNKVDPGFAKQLGGFVETAYKIATAVNQLYTAIGTLAAATGVGATTFGVYGAVIGAAIGLIQVFAGLFGGDDTTAQQQAAAQQQILDAVRNSFETLKSYLEQIYDTMNKRFDRVDAELSKIYQDMMGKFTQVINLLYDIKGDVNAVHGELLNLEQQVQSFNQQLINQVSDADKTEFLNAAHNYVDYAFQNNSPLPNYDTGGNDYVTGVNRFTTTATSTARNANFTFTDMNQQDPSVAIGAHGAVGAVDYLAIRANTQYGMSIPTSADRVPNADLWGEAARAYTLTALQNPGFAARESEARSNQILAAGQQIRDTALKFSAPVAPPSSGTWVATNPLFRGLLGDNNTARADFVTSLPSLEQEVMPPDRTYRLWDKSTGVPASRPAANQAVDIDKISTNPTDGTPNRLSAVPATISGCANSPVGVPTPDYITGRDLPNPLLLGLYAAGWTYSVCWAKPRWSDPYTKLIRTRRVIDHGNGKGKPPTYKTVYDYEQRKDVLVDFTENVNVPGTGNILGRTTTGHDPRISCSWTYDPTDPSTTGPRNCHDLGNAADLVAGSTFRTSDPGVNPTGAGYAQAQSFITEHRAQYYEVVAAKLNQGAIPQAKTLNNNVRLIQAYTDLGFPRAKETDEQLSALVYGTNALPADLPDLPVLEAVYLQAAKNVRTGKSAIQDQSLLDQDANSQSCLPPEYAGDPISGCVNNLGYNRNVALLERYELHSEAIYNGLEVQSLPLVDEAMRDLQLVRTYIGSRGASPALRRAR